ncbi:MAG: hypothetical protein V5A56_03640 [Halolamina sp.]
MSDFRESDPAGDEPESLRLTLSREGDSLRENSVLDLAGTSPNWDENAFEAASNGERYTTQYRKPFFTAPEEPTYAVEDGTYYELGSVVVDEAPTERPILRLFEVEDAETPTADAVPVSGFPEADQRAVEIAYFPARARGTEGGAPWGLVQRGGYVYRREDAVETSELLADDGPDRVTFRETTYTLETTRETVYEPVYRATAEPVAGSPDGIEANLRAQLVDTRVERSELPSEGRGFWSKQSPTSTAKRIRTRRATRRFCGASTSGRFSTGTSGRMRAFAKRPSSCSASATCTTSTSFASCPLRSERLAVQGVARGLVSRQPLTPRQPADLYVRTTAAKWNYPYPRRQPDDR